MKTLNIKVIEEAVRDLCIKANIYLPKNLENRISEYAKKETSPVGQTVFCDLIDNIECAKTDYLPICQDTGMTVIFLEIGQDIHFEGGSLYEAVNKGVARGYIEGSLRCSIVSDPLERVNSGNNTPPIIHTNIVDGDKIKITVSPKGFGSENMSALKMLTPSATIDEIIEFIVDTISKAGSNPCPPIVIGVGIGGDFEYCAYLAKKALCRDVAIRNPKKLYSDLENTILEKVNNLGIGPQGFGGNITALAVNIEQSATHIAGLPIAVNVGCHVTRHAEATL